MYSLDRPISDAEQAEFKVIKPVLQLGLWFVPVVGQGANIAWSLADVSVDYSLGNFEKGSIGLTVLFSGEAMSKFGPLSALGAHVFGTVSGAMVDRAWDSYRTPQTPKKP